MGCLFILRFYRRRRLWCWDIRALRVADDVYTLYNRQSGFFNSSEALGWLNTAEATQKIQTQSAIRSFFKLILSKVFWKSIPALSKGRAGMWCLSRLSVFLPSFLSLWAGVGLKHASKHTHATGIGIAVFFGAIWVFTTIGWLLELVPARFKNGGIVSKRISMTAFPAVFNASWMLLYGAVLCRFWGVNLNPGVVGGTLITGFDVGAEVIKLGAVVMFFGSLISCFFLAVLLLFWVKPALVPFIFEETAFAGERKSGRRVLWWTAANIFLGVVQMSVGLGSVYVGNCAIAASPGPKPLAAYATASLKVRYDIVLYEYHWKLKAAMEAPVGVGAFVFIVSIVQLLLSVGTAAVVNVDVQSYNKHFYRMVVPISVLSSLVIFSAVYFGIVADCARTLF